MNKILTICVALIASWSSCSAAQAAENRTQPNVLVILVDDLGFSDVGCFGGEIETPNLDRLANNGLRFTNFYNTGRCWPTRAALITGYYAQQVGFDLVPGEPPLKRGSRPPWAPMLPARLKPAGYRCYHAGKWHLDGQALKTGQFDRSYLLKDHGRFFSPKAHWKDDEKLLPVEPGTGYYSTTAIANHAIEFLQEHQAKHSEKPFFQFLAFTAPHFPLHALPEDIAVYEGQYDVGWNEIRRRRWQKIQAMGIATGTLSKVEFAVGPPYEFPDAIKRLGPGETNRPQAWDSLTSAQKQFQADKMELHAAMIHRIDIEVGRVLDQLLQMDQLDNTLIMFLSDNGASAEIMIRSDGHDPQATPGSAETHLCLGPGWSNACNTPFRRHKTWVHEGGIHTPLIVHWPAGISARGGLRSTVGHVVDIVPTVLDLVDAPEDLTRFTGDVPPFAGRSLLPAITDDVEINRESLWWFHEGNRAIRAGNFKLVAAKDEPWGLFDLSADPTEQEDLIDQLPAQARQLETAWNDQLESIRSQVIRDRSRRSAAPD